MHWRRPGHRDAGRKPELVAFIVIPAHADATASPALDFKPLCVWYPSERISQFRYAEADRGVAVNKTRFVAAHFVFPERCKCGVRLISKNRSAIQIARAYVVEGQCFLQK